MLIPTFVVRDVAEALTFHTGVLDFQPALVWVRPLHFTGA